jgi:hypothetical protein
LPKAESKNVEQKERARITDAMDMDSVQDVVEQVSEAMKHCEITNIDADDFENPQLCAEYANEIYQYLMKYEVFNFEMQYKLKSVLLRCCSKVCSYRARLARLTGIICLIKLSSQALINIQNAISKLN